MLAFLVRGGPLMIPLAALSLVSAAVIVERALALYRTRQRRARLGEYAVNLLRGGQLRELCAELEQMGSPEASMLLAGLRPARATREEREALMQAEAARLVSGMEQHVPLLSGIANIATLLGLLGTVAGMIVSFADMRASGLSNPAVLAGGISQALITTAAGLSVAIPSLLAHYVFSQVLGRAATRMEIASSLLSSYLAEKSAPARTSSRSRGE